MRVKKLLCEIQIKKQEKKLACLCFSSMLTTIIKRRGIILSGG